MSHAEKVYFIGGPADGTIRVMDTNYGDKRLWVPTMRRSGSWTVLAEGSCPAEPVYEKAEYRIERYYAPYETFVVAFYLGKTFSGMIDWEGRALKAEAKLRDVELVVKR